MKLVPNSSITNVSSFRELQGTTMFTVAALEWDIEKMMKSATLICPVIYLNHVTNIIGSIGAHAYLAEVCVFSSSIESM